jgi:hypothetical protein
MFGFLLFMLRPKSWIQILSFLTASRFSPVVAFYKFMGVSVAANLG